MLHIMQVEVSSARCRRKSFHTEWNYSTMKLAVVGSSSLHTSMANCWPTIIPLLPLIDSKDYGGHLAHWLLYMLQFNFQFEHKCSATNSNAHALSRIPRQIYQLQKMRFHWLSLRMHKTMTQTLLKQHMKRWNVPPDCPSSLKKCFKDGIICSYACAKKF